MVAAARRAQDGFVATFGRRPDVVADAPGRVNLIGEHVDYLGGPVLPVPLHLRTAVALARRDDDRVVLRSVQAEQTWQGTSRDLRPGTLQGWAAYVGGVLWALAEDGWEVPGLDVLVDGDVPLGAGLSSSAAVECATAVAVAGLLGVGLTDPVRRRLIAACVRAERDVAGAPTGGMDQTVALLAAPGSALLIDFGTDPPRTQEVPLALADAGLALLVTDTGVRHRLADGAYAARRREAEAAAAALGVDLLASATPDAVAALADPINRRRARHAVTEVARVRDVVAALRDRDWVAVGDALAASHRSLRDDYQVSCPELDVAVDASQEAGALGARMTGGGFGGSTVALVATDRLPVVARAIEGAYAARGWGTPRHHRIGPGSPARLVD